MNKCLKTIKSILIVVMVIYFAGAAYASGDIVVQLRLYEGFNEEGNASGVIVSSYYLQKLPGDNIIPFVEVSKEKKSLKRIYKLKDVSQIASLDLVLKKGKAETQYQELALNGRKLTIQLSAVPGKKDRFKMEVRESPSKKQALLETEIIMPEKKTAVLGFKDSSEKIYFLAFNREKDRVVTGAKQVLKPKLLHYKVPEYPQAALKKRLEGAVLLEGSTDLDGNVVHLQVLKGDPILAEVSKKATLQWKYRTWKIDGVSKPLDFIIIYLFKSEDNKKDTVKWIGEFFEENKGLLKKPKRERRIMENVVITGKFSDK